MGSVQQPHAVLVPFPSQGHVSPFMQLAKLLHARGFYITFVHNEHNHQRLIRTKGPDSVKGLPDFRFKSIPDGLPPSDLNATQNLIDLCIAVQNNCLAPFRELLKKLNSTQGVPPVSCIVSDAVMTFTMEVAAELRVPEAQFWTASVCGLMGYLQYPELAARGIIPLKDESDFTDEYLATPLPFVPGMQQVGVRLREIPTFCRITNPDDAMFHYLIQQTTNCLKSRALVINTIDELEKDVIEALPGNSPKVCPIGPLTLLSKKSVHKSLLDLMNSTSLWKENTQCLDWLDKQEPGSVVYVNFGSIAVITEHHMREFAGGLANCGYPFLWILRSDSIIGSSSLNLPEGFKEETRDRGFITNWCPQQKVLAHPSVGVFITHAGWNSTLEFISAGVPVLCWAVHGEQPMNVRFITRSWGNGLEIDPDVTEKNVVELVKEIMVGEKGKEVKRKALEWKRKAEEATSEGGSSFKNLEWLIDEVLLKKL